MKNVLDLKMPGVMELGRNELKKFDGGNVPSSWYMDNDTIAMNGRIGDAFFSFWGGVVSGFFD